MTPLPTALGGVDLLGWRLDKEVYSSTWDSGIGAERFGGRWNNKGTRVVYAALDPSTAILEVAVHTGFETIDSVHHRITSFTITDISSVYVVQPHDIPNPRRSEEHTSEIQSLMRISYAVYCL